jgi:DNA-binding NtrC family response regulator
MSSCSVSARADGARSTSVIFATAGNDAEVAIEAMRRGAFDYLRKPTDLEQLRTILLEAIEVRRQSRAFAPVGESAPDAGGGDALFGTCPAMLEVYKAIVSSPTGTSPSWSRARVGPARRSSHAPSTGTAVAPRRRSLP